MHTADNSFDKVHSDLRNGNLAKALRSVFDSNTGLIRKTYSADRNHAWYLVGSINFKRRKYPEAIKCFRNAIRHWPEDWQALMAIANCYSEMALPRWSIFYLRRAIKLQPKNASLLFNLGNAYFDSNDFDAAHETYLKAYKCADKQLARLCRKNLDLVRRARG